jgi:dTDP-4-dehydrorhamnose reductase
MEYCEDHIKASDYSNLYLVEDILRYYPHSKIIHFSSYYVYDDIGLCNENSNTTDKYAYTRQKLNSEKLITNGVVFRVGKLFGNKEKDQNKLVGYIMKNNNLILDSVLFNPTSTHQILRVIKYELESNKLNGIYNLANIGFTSPYELGIFINELLGTNKHITKIEKMDRMFHNYGNFLMDISKLNSIYPLTYWKEDLKEHILC